MNATIAIITVLYKSAADMPALIESVANVDYPRELLTLHIVDNNPGDGSLDEAKKHITRFADLMPRIVFHEPGWNSGFAGGNNIAIRDALNDNVSYVYLLNADASFESGALREAVAVAQTDQMFGSVQSLIVLQQNPQEVNSRGNAIHFLGMGYCLGYHEKRGLISDDVRKIAYASGAGVLYSARALRSVGLFDETFWMYHEDLDLGWRMMLSGYTNVLAPKSVIRHRYEFSRSVSKWYWMERNRIAVVFKNYHLLTIILLLPQLWIADLALMVYAIKGGYWKEKIRAHLWFWSPRSWAFLLRGRAQIAKKRTVSDRVILSAFTSRIAYQEFEDPMIKNVVNPAWDLLFMMVKMIVKW
jgi:GT2 family glycosyltransferase